MNTNIQKYSVSIDLSEGICISDIDETIGTLIIYNTTNKKLLKGELQERISNITNLDLIESLHITGRFNIDDCELLRLFPNIKSLMIDTDNMASLDGLKFAKQLKYLELNMKREHKTNIGDISNTNITSIRIEHPTNMDLKILAQCDKLKDIELFNCDEVDLCSLDKSFVERLEIINATNRIIGNFSNLKNLKSLCIAYCKNLNRITNANQNVDKLWIESCNKLDMYSVGEFKNISTLTIKKCKSAIDLNVLNLLEKLVYVDIQVCNIDVTKKVILEKLKVLKEIYVSKIDNNRLIEISKDNPRFVFENVNIKVLGGILLNKM